MDPGEELSRNVRAKRQERGWSQERLARNADVSTNVVFKIENRLIVDPHYSTLSALARAFGEPVAALVGEREPLKADAPSLPEEERRDLEDLDFDELIKRYQDLTDQRDAVARALVRKGPYTETELSAALRERRERDVPDETGEAEVG